MVISPLTASNWSSTVAVLFAHVQRQHPQPSICLSMSSTEHCSSPMLLGYGWLGSKYFFDIDQMSLCGPDWQVVIDNFIYWDIVLWVDILGVDIWEVDILGVDILGGTLDAPSCRFAALISSSYHWLATSYKSQQYQSHVTMPYKTWLFTSEFIPLHTWFAAV